MQRVYDKLDGVQKQIDAHEKSDLEVHGEFRASLVAIDGKLDGLTKASDQTRENTAKIVWAVLLAVLVAVLNLVIRSGVK